MDCFACSLECILFIFLLVLWRYSRSWLRIKNVKDRHVFITGCDTGFGRLLAETLDRKGVHVYAGCLLQCSVDELKEKCSSRLKPLVVDVTNETSVRAAAAFVRKELDGKALWGLVNNAGIAGTTVPFEWSRKEDCQQVLDVNLLGVYDVTLAFWPLIKKGKEGRIVNIASVFGRVGHLLGGYAMSKHGIEAFSDGLSLELSPYNVTVHTLEPGFFATNLPTKDAVESGLRKRFNDIPNELRERLGGKKHMEELCEFANKFLERGLSPKINLVVEAYEHALFARYPKNRYVVGNDAKFLYIPLSWLPFPYQMRIVSMLQSLFGIQRPVPKDAVKAS